MLRTKLVKLLAATCLALAVLPGCSTNVQGDDASPIFLSVEFTLAPLQKNVADGVPLQVQSIALRSIFKNPTGGSSDFLDTRLDDYLVEWRRLDGGRSVPQPEVFGGNIIIPAGGSSTLSNFPVMSATALGRSPLDKLFPFNGGIDPETGNTEMRMVAIVTFRGHTLSGQPVRGQGTLDMIFLYVPPAGRSGSK